MSLSWTGFERHDFFDETTGDCPDCGKGNMRFHQSEHTEPHGEHVSQQWFGCSSCGFIDDASNVLTATSSEQSTSGQAGGILLPSGGPARSFWLDHPDFWGGVGYALTVALLIWIAIALDAKGW